MEQILGAESRHLFLPLLTHLEVLLDLGDRSGARKIFERVQVVAAKPPEPSGEDRQLMKDLEARVEKIPR